MTRINQSLQKVLRVLVIPGDGIGREVIPAATEVLRATGLPIELIHAEAGWDCFERTGVALPEATLAAAQQSDAILFGAVASPSRPVPGYRSPIVALRRALDLYANIRPVTELPGLAQSSSRKTLVNLVVVRENTEDLYLGRERLEDNGDTAIAERVITRRASERIVRAAFELARQRHTTTAPRVTIVHKANVLRETCGLFRAAAFKVAEEYPDIATDELLVDTAALQLVQRPERFDVLVTTNMFGDILSDVASYWGGGLGLAASANIGDTQALFEPVHGAAPDIAGNGIANPLAAIECIAALLEYLGGRTRSSDDPDLADRLVAWAARIRTATHTTLASGPRTPDLGGSAGTAEVTSAIIGKLKE